MSIINPQYPGQSVIVFPTDPNETLFEHYLTGKVTRLTTTQYEVLLDSYIEAQVKVIKFWLEGNIPSGNTEGVGARWRRYSGQLLLIDLESGLYIDTDIHIKDIIYLINQSTSDRDIIASYPSLSKYHLHQARLYYSKYKQELDKIIYSIPND
jgi:hypothetical protein